MWSAARRRPQAKIWPPFQDQRRLKYKRRHQHNKERGGLSKVAFRPDRLLKGTLLGQGSNVNGALGNGSTKRAVLPTPVLWPAGNETFKSLSCGWGHSAAVDSDGNVFMWGRTHDVQQAIRFIRMERNSPWLQNLVEMFGSNNSIDSLEPALVPLPLGEKAVSVSCGGGLTAVLTERGQVMCLGSNLYGQCGLGTRSAYQYEPLPVEGFEHGDEEVVKVEVGFRHCVAVTAKGSVYTWGKGNRGQIAKGSTAAADMLRAHKVVSGDLGPCISVTAGFNHCLALQSDGVVKAWGKFQRRIIATEDGQDDWVRFDDAWVPVKVDFPSGTKPIKRIWSGTNHNIAQTEDDEFFQWGRLSDQSAELAPGAAKQVAARTDPDPRPPGDLSRFVVHSPVKVEMRPDVCQAPDLILRAGFDKTFLTAPSKLDSPLVWDWSCRPISLALIEPDMHDFCQENEVVAISPGWMHRLILAQPRMIKK